MAYISGIIRVGIGTPQPKATSCHSSVLIMLFLKSSAKSSAKSLLGESKDASLVAEAFFPRDFGVALGLVAALIFFGVAGGVKSSMAAAAGIDGE